MSAISVLYLEAHFSGNWRSGALFKQMSTVIELFGLFLFMHFRRWGLPLQFLFVLPSINIHFTPPNLRCIQSQDEALRAIEHIS
jgi:hypothetical protein